MAEDAIAGQNFALTAMTKPGVLLQIGILHGFGERCDVPSLYKNLTLVVLKAYTILKIGN